MNRHPALLHVTQVEGWLQVFGAKELSTFNL
jgi:hypothetical protein